MEEISDIDIFSGIYVCYQDYMGGGGGTFLDFDERVLGKISR